MHLSIDFAATLVKFGGAISRIDPNCAKATIDRITARARLPSRVTNVSGVRLASGTCAVPTPLSQPLRSDRVGSHWQFGAYNASAPVPRYRPEVRERIAQFERISAGSSTVQAVAQRRPLDLRALARAFVAAAPADERGVLSPISPIESANFRPLASLALVRAVSQATAPAIEPQPTVESEKCVDSSNGVRSLATAAGKDISRFLGFHVY